MTHVSGVYCPVISHLVSVNIVHHTVFICTLRATSTVAGMPRNARQRGGSRHTRGRKAGARSGTAGGSRRSAGNTFGLENFVQVQY